MTCRLTGVGHYVSPQGGAHAPATIRKGELLFELLTAGSVYAPSDNQLCGPGWVFTHLPGQQTIWRSPSDAHYECMTARFTVPPEAQAEPWPRQFLWDNDETAVGFAHEMLYAFHHTHVDNQILGDLIWSQLRFRLDHYRRQERRSEIPPRVAAVLAYIDRHFSESIGVEDMSAHIGLSASHLHARFKEYVGMSPHQYLIRQRMRSAQHQLATTTTPIKAISAEIGYVNQENFCRAFKKHFGTTAAAYRDRFRIYPNR